MDMDTIIAIALSRRGINSSSSTGISNVQVDADGNLIFTLSDGSTVNAGQLPSSSEAQLVWGTIGE